MFNLHSKKDLIEAIQSNSYVYALAATATSYNELVEKAKRYNIDLVVFVANGDTTLDNFIKEVS